MDLNPYESPQTPHEPVDWRSLFVRFWPKFTVIELLIVMAIVAWLIAVMAPAISSGRHGSRPRSGENLQFTP